MRHKLPSTVACAERQSLRTDELKLFTSAPDSLSLAVIVMDSGTCQSAIRRTPPSTVSFPATAGNLGLGRRPGLP